MRTNVNSSAKAWFDSPLGQQVLAVEAQLCEDALQLLFGFHLLQLGVTPSACLYKGSRINHCFTGMSGEGADLELSYDQLPFEADSIDVVILHHVMDVAPNPHQLLREVNRVLAPHGHVLVLSMNPWSLLGAHSMWSRRRPGGFPLMRLLSRRRLHDWFELMDYEVITARSGFFGLPSNSARGLQLARKWELLSQRLQLPWGGIHLVVARKRIGAVTPVRPHWGARPRLVAIPQMKPTATGASSHNLE